METLKLDAVRRCLSAHVPLYSWHQPVYQHAALLSLQRLWDRTHDSVLDVGGGTGVMAQAIKTLFGVRRTVAVDVQNRFLPGLDIETDVYDGRTLPFADGSFDCIVLLNVLHHVPVTARAPLLRECRRVAGRGPIYIKDHLSTGYADDLRLAFLDLMGNVPFHGMVRAKYLREQDWQALAQETAHASSEHVSGAYRGGAFAELFPNRLEVTMRWRPA